MLVNQTLILSQYSCALAFHCFWLWRLPNIEGMCGFKFCLSKCQQNALGNSPVSPETQLSSLYVGERSVGPVYSEWQWRPSFLKLVCTVTPNCQY